MIGFDIVHYNSTNDDYYASGANGSIDFGGYGNFSFQLNAGLIHYEGGSNPAETFGAHGDRIAVFGKSGAFVGGGFF